jgi:predicted phage-related endonuclease
MIPGWRVEELPRGSRADWMGLRQRVLCASEAGALFGRHKYTTPRRLFTAKAYGEPEEESAVMRRGKIMEPAVAEAVAVDCGWEPERCSTFLQAFAADPFVRLGASRDYVLRVDAADLLAHPKTRETVHRAGWETLAGALRLTLECKSLDPAIWASEWKDGPPAYTVVQAAQQALLDGSDGALVACLLEDRAKTLYLYAVPRHEDFEAALVGKVAGFWRAFEAGEEPPVVALDNEFMTEYFPTSDEGELCNLTEEAAEWQALAAERERLKLQVKSDEVLIDAIEAKFKDRMRSAARAILPGWSITWKTGARGRTFKVDRRAETPKPKRTRR